MTTDNNFIDGWIISFLKCCKTMPKHKQRELVAKMSQYLQEVSRIKGETDKTTKPAKKCPKASGAFKTAKKGHNSRKKHQK